MVRNVLNKKQVQDEPEMPEVAQAHEAVPAEVQVVEREITIALLNEKLNYLISAVQKIADAADVKL